MKLVFATNNSHKLKEVQEMLPNSIQLVSLKDINCTEDVAETETTLQGNAALKANFITQNFQLDSFADDTGLEVDALGGAPGVHSARYASEQRSDEANMDKLLLELGPGLARDAQFKTVITYCQAQKQVQFTGIVRGKISEVKRGDQGFGYDPVFMAEDTNLTFAQMPLEQKNNYSHRARAMKQFLSFLTDQI